jgi:hypothetical protein
MPDRFHGNGESEISFGKYSGQSSDHIVNALFIGYCLGAARWCNVVQHTKPGAVSVPGPKRKPPKTSISRSPRTSVTFPPDIYQTLEDLAKKKKVSVAWIVRDAAEKYIAEQWPLFAGSKNG